MDKLPRVRKGDPITATAWNDVVDKVNGKPDLSIKRGHLVKRGDDVRLARLQTAWFRNAANVWQATACFVVNDRVDTSFPFDVFAPLATSEPPGAPRSQRFFVVWRGRWESMQSFQPVARYYGGDHIQVTSLESASGYSINNTGMTQANIVTNGVIGNYYDCGTFYLNGRFFKWVPSTLDIIDKRELWLKTARKQVVTGVSQNPNGTLNVTTEYITVLSET